MHRTIATLIIVAAALCQSCASHFTPTTRISFKDPTIVEVWDADHNGLVLAAGDAEVEKTLTVDCGPLGTQSLTLSRHGRALVASAFREPMVDASGRSAELGTDLNVLRLAAREMPAEVMGAPFRVRLASSSGYTGIDEVTTTTCGKTIMLRTPKANVAKVREVAALDYGPAIAATLGSAGAASVIAIPFFIFDPMPPIDMLSSDPGGEGFPWVLVSIGAGSSVALLLYAGGYVLLGDDVEEIDGAP